MPGLVGHYPLDGFVETKDRMDLPDLVSPSKPGYFWGDRDKLPEIIDGVVGKGMRLRGDGWLDMGNKRFYFERNQPFLGTRRPFSTTSTIACSRTNARRPSALMSDVCVCQ